MLFTIGEEVDTDLWSPVEQTASAVVPGEASLKKTVKETWWGLTYWSTLMRKQGRSDLSRLLL
ncbi:MAG: hypothetical protein ACKPKO_56940, partial [Candidatus Fonsibacter sp.]